MALNLRPPFANWLLLIVSGLSALTGTACDTPADAPSLPPRDTCAIVAVQSDYRSTSVSLLTADGAPCAPDLIDSGSRAPGLLTALSGDVVCGGPLPDGTFPLLDRYPAGVATLVDPRDGHVEHQLPLAQGFAGNPQDLLAIGPAIGLASRLQRAPATHPDHPAGSDLVVLDLTTTPTLVPRPIALDGLAEPGFDPMPARIATATGAVFVGLAHLRPDFAAAGPGRIARIPLPSNTSDAAAWAMTAAPTAIPLSDLENCTQVRASATGEGVWVACSGSFRRGASQGGRSGLAFVTADGALRALLPAAVLTPDAAPLGFTLAAIDADHAVVVALGDPASGRPDRALLVTLPDDDSSTWPLTAPASVAVLHEGPAFELGDALFLPATRSLLLADGDPVDPGLWRIGPLPIPSGGEIDGPIPPATRLPDASRTGLPPRWLCAFKDLGTP